MLCQKCQTNVATIRYAEVVDGRVTEQHVCAACVAVLEKGVSSGFELSEVGPRARRPAPESAAVAARSDDSDQQACGVCGMPLAGILATQHVGCPSCYDNFPSEIGPMLQAVHRFSAHKGKSAHTVTVREQLRSALHAKRGLLRSVLREENYEEAARLRDEIKRLESGLTVGERGAD